MIKQIPNKLSQVIKILFRPRLGRIYKIILQNQQCQEEMKRVCLPLSVIKYPDYMSYHHVSRGSFLSAYLLLVAAIHWISPICCSIHAWIMRRWHYISVIIINLSSIIWRVPLVAQVSSKLSNPKAITGTKPTA